MRGLGLFSIRWMVCFLLSVEWNGLVKSVCIHLYTVDVEIVNRVMKKSNNNWLTLRGHYRALQSSYGALVLRAKSVMFVLCYRKKINNFPLNLFGGLKLIIFF